MDARVIHDPLTDRKQLMGLGWMMVSFISMLSSSRESSGYHTWSNDREAKVDYRENPQVYLSKCNENQPRLLVKLIFREVNKSR